MENDIREETSIPSNIPQQFKEKYKSIASMIRSFCDEKLDDEYKELCIQAPQKLCRKKAEPISTGRNNMWAAGIVYAIAQNCNLMGNRDFFMSIPAFHLSADDVSSYFGVSKGGHVRKSESD